MSPVDPTTPLPLAGLAALAEVVEHHTVAEGERAALLRARRLGDEVELGWLPLRADVHPVDELVGTTAPPDWCALGIAAPGRATSLADLGRSAVRVHTVYLVGRDGSWASRWGAPGEMVVAAGDADDPGRPLGRVDDVCRRALGLPTGGPPASTALLWALQWLDAVVDLAVEASGRPRPLAWPAVARRHPAIGALRADREAAVPRADALAHLADQLRAWRDWSSLRRACAAGTWAGAGVAPDVAAWLDDGAFARWVLGAYPELDDLRDAVAALVPVHVAAEVDSTLAASGVVRR